MENDLLNKSIAIVIVLFILSLISERFITWFKLYFFKKGNTLFKVFFDWDKDYSKKTQDPDFEKEREQRILLLNISLSIVIAFLAHANIFKILSAPNPFDGLGWDGNGLGFDLKTLQTAIGCILSGFFISLGSKFWHDTLGLLLYSKNLKEKLSQKETYKVENIQQLDNWLKLTQSDIVKKVFDDNKEMLKSIRNVVSVGIGQENDKKCIIIEMLGENLNMIPKSLNYTSADGLSVPVNVNTVTTTVIKTHLQPTTDITNSTRNQSIGSFGLAVYFKNDTQKRPMLLSCYHVLKGLNHDYDSFEILNQEEIVSPHGTRNFIGKLRYGIRNNTIDAAIMMPSEGIVLNNNLPNNQKIKGWKEIPLEEQYSQIQVSIYGALSSSHGTIKSMYNYAEISYTMPNGKLKTWEMYNLIAISNNGKAISQPGDSGAPITDNNNNVIGIVVAGNNTTTYAIPIKPILDMFNLNII